MSISGTSPFVSPPRVIRNDIQALRGIAILFVLLFHALPARFPAGYLGVDVFFVVSGYLITGLLSREIGAGTFTFRSFYFRRAKRLLPAAYVTFAVTAILAVVLLSTSERRDFAKQLLGGLTFSTNFVLWRTVNYFNSSAELKPLLHIWSLAIEEQFYLLLPGVMFFLPRRYWLRFIALGFAASIALCFTLAPMRPEASFYLLPTRGWELAMGAVGVLSGISFSGRARSILASLALVVLVLIPMRPLDVVHPRWDAFLVCLATLVVLLCNHPRLSDSPPARLFAFVGDFSYSLYLVHWPLLAFANNIWLTPVPTEVRIALLCLSLVLGYLLYRTVEKPLWRAPIQFSMRAFAVIGASSAALGIAAVLVGWFASPPVDYANVRRANYGFSPACAFTSDFAPVEACRSSATPRVLVWGDSYAMHLVAGIEATTDGGVIQATRSLCGPFVGIAPYDGKTRGRHWAEKCISFNDSVLGYLERAPSVETVVLASSFVLYADESAKTQPSKFLRRRNGELTLVDGGAEPSLEAMKETVTRIRALGKRVVVVAPPPSDGASNIGECLERRALKLPSFGMSPVDCAISTAAYHRNWSGVRELLDRFPARAGVEVFSFDSFLCTTESCRAEIDGTFLYRDTGHLSYAGSEFLGRQLRLSERLSQLAR